MHARVLPTRQRRPFPGLPHRAANFGFGMPELPWVKWFPCDWASDPLLSMCDVATQGVWMNAINAMHLINSTRLSGTLDELCTPCRCRRSQLETAIAELKSKKVGNITEQGVNIIIECRRLVREHKIKDLKRKAGLASAKQRQHTPQQSEPTEWATRSEYASVSVSVSDPPEQDRGVGKGFIKPTVEEVKLYCAKSGIPESDAVWFFNKCEGNGWTNGGKKIKRWGPTLTSWKAAGYLPSQKAQAAGPTRRADGSPDFSKVSCL